MSIERFLNDRIGLHAGDCRDVLATLEECSFNACVTDPPYGLSFMGKGWDHGVPGVAFWGAVYRVLKPGGWLVAMGGTRTYHRLACAIENAGFEIRDQIGWLYGSGFPKSHNLGVAIDRMSGISARSKAFNMKGRGDRAEELDTNGREFLPPYEPATDAARQWQGWGTALKPAWEPIVLARKPLSEGTVAANVLKWGTGAINVDGCRVGTNGGTASTGDPNYKNEVYGRGMGGLEIVDLGKGRWPANIIHDGSDEVVAAFPESGNGSGVPTIAKRERNKGWCNSSPGEGVDAIDSFGDSGSAARFFYTAKADADDRLGSKHPTVKPLDLMQYLVRLVTPKGGTVLDPFAGTGTTGEAAWREGMAAELIEAEAEYCVDIRRRMALALSGPDERAREAIKARNLPRDDGPLFASRETWRQMWARPFDYSQLESG
jgi:DNA modification methylase